MPFLDVKQAVQSASEFLQKVYDRQLPDLRLEEVDRTVDDNWLITFGYTEIEEPANAFQALADRRRRVYKQIEVEGRTGEGLAMRIRTV